MPREYADLYKLIVNSKVEVPQRKYLNWPRGMPRSLMSDQTQAGDVNNQLRLSHTLHPDLLVSQPNLNPLIHSQAPSPDRQLRPDDRAESQSREAVDSLSQLRDHRVAVVTKIMSGDVANIDMQLIEWIDRRQTAEMYGLGDDKEVKLAQEAEDLLNQFIGDRDDAMLQVGLMTAYQTHLNQDLFEQIGNGHRQTVEAVANAQPQGGLRQGTVMTEVASRSSREELVVADAVAPIDVDRQADSLRSPSRPQAIRLQTVPEAVSIGNSRPSSIANSNNINPMIDNRSRNADVDVRPNIAASNGGNNSMSGRNRQINSIGQSAAVGDRLMANDANRSIAESSDRRSQQGGVDARQRVSGDRLMADQNDNLRVSNRQPSINANNRSGIQNSGGDRRAIEASRHSSINMNRIERDRSPASVNLNIEEPLSDFPVRQQMRQSPDKSPAFNVKLISLNPKPEANAWLNDLKDSAHSTWSNLGKTTKLEKPVDSLRPPPKTAAEASSVFKAEVDQHILRLTQQTGPVELTRSSLQSALVPGESQLFADHPISISNSQLPTMPMINMFTGDLLIKAAAVDKRRNEMAAVADADNKSLAILRTELAHFINERRRQPVSRLADTLAQDKTPQLSDCIAWLESAEQDVILQKMNYIRMIDQAAKINRDMANQVIVVDTRELETDAIDQDRSVIDADIVRMRDQRDRLTIKLDMQRREIDTLANECRSTMSDADKQKATKAKIAAFDKLCSLKQKEVDRYREYLRSMRRQHQDYKIASQRYYSNNRRDDLADIDFGKGLQKLLSQTVKSHQEYRY